MHWSPDALTAIRRSRLYEPAEQSRQPHHTMPHTVRRAVTNERSRPDYGCVDWFVYEEPPTEQNST